MAKTYILTTNTNKEGEASLLKKIYIYKCQSDFRKLQSTVTALIKINVEFVKGFDTLTRCDKISKKFG